MFIHGHLSLKIKNKAVIFAVEKIPHSDFSSSRIQAKKP
jgi:hypothetical protein